MCQPSLCCHSLGSAFEAQDRLLTSHVPAAGVCHGVGIWPPEGCSKTGTKMTAQQRHLVLEFAVTQLRVNIMGESDSQYYLIIMAEKTSFHCSHNIHFLGSNLQCKQVWKDLSHIEYQYLLASQNSGEHQLDPLTIYPSIASNSSCIQG